MGGRGGGGGPHLLGNNVDKRSYHDAVPSMHFACDVNSFHTIHTDCHHREQ